MLGCAIAVAVTMSGLGDRPAAPPPDVRAEIERVLAAMTRAVRSGDEAAYLRHVSRSSAPFAMEQIHWADELAAHRPLEFTLAIVDDVSSLSGRSGPAKWGKADFGESRAVCALRLTYRMSVGHAAGPGGKSAAWPAVFLKEDPDADGPEPSRWLYAGEQWQSLQGRWLTASGTGLFTVKFFPGFETVAEQVREAFPPAKRHDDEGFDVHFTRPIEIKLFDDMEHLKSSVYLNMPDDVLGGWNEPGESIKFMTHYASSVPRWTAAFAHEYGHTVTWELGPHMHASPWWLQEGVAELAAEHFVKDAQRIDSMMRARAKKTGRAGLIPWDDLADYQKAEAGIKQFAYFQGHHFVGWISDQWGRAGRNTWLRAIGAGKSLDEASREVFAESFDSLDQRWRRELGSSSQHAVPASAPTP